MMVNRRDRTTASGAQDFKDQGRPRARRLYCILSGDEFKVGFQFVNLDPATTTVLARFLR
jgi:hypothetical protein